MAEQERMIGEMSGQEFGALVEGFIERLETEEDERLPAPVFFELWAGQEQEEEVIEIEGRVVDNQIVFLEPQVRSPSIIVEGNEILVGQCRLRISLVEG